jgi:hypothetical protein
MSDFYSRVEKRVDRAKTVRDYDVWGKKVERKKCNCDNVKLWLGKESCDSCPNPCPDPDDEEKEKVGEE